MSNSPRTDALVESFHYAESGFERYEAMLKLAKDLEQDIKNGVVFLEDCRRERDQLKLDRATLAEELAELKDEAQADALAEMEHPRNQ